MILAIVKQQLRQIRNISRFRFAIAGLLSIITKYKNNLKSRAHKECMAKIGRYVEPSSKGIHPLGNMPFSAKDSRLGATTSGNRMLMAAP